MSDVIIPTSPSGTSERSAKLETRAEHLFLKCTYCDGSGEPYDGVECPECFGFGTEQTPVFPITLEDLDEITDATPRDR